MTLSRRWLTSSRSPGPWSLFRRHLCPEPPAPPVLLPAPPAGAPWRPLLFTALFFCLYSALWFPFLGRIKTCLAFSVIAGHLWNTKNTPCFLTCSGIFKKHISHPFWGLGKRGGYNTPSRACLVYSVASRRTADGRWAASGNFITFLTHCHFLSFLPTCKSSVFTQPVPLAMWLSCNCLA